MDEPRSEAFTNVLNIKYNVNNLILLTKYNNKIIIKCFD